MPAQHKLWLVKVTNPTEKWTTPDLFLKWFLVILILLGEMPIRRTGVRKVLLISSTRVDTGPSA